MRDDREPWFLVRPGAPSATGRTLELLLPCLQPGDQVALGLGSSKEVDVQVVGARPGIGGPERASCPRPPDRVRTDLVCVVRCGSGSSGIYNSSRVLRRLVTGADSWGAQSLLIIPRRHLTNGTYCP